MRYIFLFILFTSCSVNVQYNKINEKSKLSFPELGKAVTAGVGDDMVKKGQLVNYTFLRVKKAFKKIQAREYTQIGDNKYLLFFTPENLRAENYISIATKKKDDGYLYLISVKGKAYRHKVEHEIINRDIPEENSFQQTLIFNGLIGNKLNIGYREYSDQIARPAFSNNVEYDLSTSRVIGYKGCKIEIIKADNESITYKVIKNFD